MNKKIIAGGAAALLAVGLGVAAVGSTSAYFSDTNSGGHVEATFGSIKVMVDGKYTTTPTIEFHNMLPGEVRSGDFDVKNIGRNAQDVYIQFPNEDQLALINSLGTYGAIQVKAGDKIVFESDNLGWPALPSELQVAEGLNPGETINVQFSLKLAEKFETQFPAIPVKLHYNVVATQPGIAPGA